MAGNSEAEILRRLDLGASRAIIDNKPTSPLGDLLVGLSEEVIERLQDRLKFYDVNASGGLSQSLGVTEVNISGDVISVGISADFYWKFINYGVNGTETHHGAPSYGQQPRGEQSYSESIKGWIQHRGLQLPPQFRSFDSFTFAIMTNIKKHGKKARPFFSDVVNNKLVDVMREPIQAVFGRALTVTIVEPWQ